MIDTDGRKNRKALSAIVNCKYNLRFKGGLKEKCDIFVKGKAFEKKVDI